MSEFRGVCGGADDCEVGCCEEGAGCCFGGHLECQFEILRLMERWIQKRIACLRLCLRAETIGKLPTLACTTSARVTKVNWFGLLELIRLRESFTLSIVKRYLNLRFPEVRLKLISSVLAG